MISELKLAFSVALMAFPLSDPTSATGADEEVELARSVQNGLVRVEYTIQYDKGDAPRGTGWDSRCPNCGRYHGADSASKLVEEERPFELGGYLVTDREVMVRDFPLHPRFIKSIDVSLGDERVPAKVDRLAMQQCAQILRLERPLSGASPLVMDPTAQKPYRIVTHERSNGVWTTSVRSLPTSVSTTSDGLAFVPVTTPGLIVGGGGRPVSMWMSEEFPPDDSWKESYETWEWLSMEQLSKHLATLESRAASGLVGVTMKFRSPRKGDRGGSSRFSWSDDGDNEDSQEKHVMGLIYAPDRVLVLANLTPKVTSRLEEVAIQSAEGKSRPAKFVGSLQDYGAFVVELAAPLPEAPIPFFKGDLRKYRRAVQLCADVYMQGKNRIAYFTHQHFSGFETRWKGRTYPELSGSQDREFLFTASGELTACYIVRRPKVSIEKDRWDSDERALTPALYLYEALSSIPQSTDTSNVPLSAEEENRLAWLGVEFQAMTRELARINGVSDQTRDGSIGALVSYVYPDSPATKIGIDVGDILLRLHVQGQPKPVDVKLEDADDYLGGHFPWDELDQVPAEYLDDLPKPWSPAENSFIRAMTDLGIGKEIEAELIQSGKAVRKKLTIALGPAHYDSAAQFKSEPFGLTVRDLTYEVRRYFQKQPTDPGVIVSKVESGGKAAVAKIIPYEVITHVNNQPVNDVKAFEKLIANQDELRLSVNRMHKGRIVKIKPGKKKPNSPARVDAAKADEPTRSDESAASGDSPKAASKSEIDATKAVSPQDAKQEPSNTDEPDGG